MFVPIEIIEEIDRFKRESTELGQNARSVRARWTACAARDVERRRGPAQRRPSGIIFQTERNKVRHLNHASVDDRT
jgi:predicted ribonuclease YlaK